MGKEWRRATGLYLVSTLYFCMFYVNIILVTAKLIYHDVSIEMSG